MSRFYKQSGVDIDAGSRAVNLMKDAVRKTYNEHVLSDLGNFGGLFSLQAIAGMKNPVLVASTDGVGTKTKVAAKMNRWDTIGQDLVNHCINDILVQGAKPLFFMDYVASDKLYAEQIATIVGGMAQACQNAGCALLGGETAEMPGVYEAGEIDVVGTIVGAVDKDKLIDGSRIQAGDMIIGLPSSGLHTNGYTLARSILRIYDWDALQPILSDTIGEVLLEVHRSYLPHIQQLENRVDIRGLAHITGGGIKDNLPRILPDGLGALIRRETWEVPPIFQLIQAIGDIPDEEMLRVFNMGLGMLIVLPSEQAQTTLDSLDSPAYIVGEIISDSQGVQFV